MIDLTPSADQFIEKGSLLLAEPFISDPFFKRTVILVCDHGKEGSFGFVLNNYVEVELSQLMEDFPDDKINVSIGGPVKSSNLFYLHTKGELIPNSAAIMDGLYFGGDFDHPGHGARHATFDVHHLGLGLCWLRLDDCVPRRAR
jgi:putative transcriptional regulator